MKDSAKLYKTLGRRLAKLDAREEALRAACNPTEPTVARDHWTAYKAARKAEKARLRAEAAKTEEQKLREQAEYKAKWDKYWSTIR